MVSQGVTRKIGAYGLGNGKSGKARVFRRFLLRGLSGEGVTRAALSGTLFDQKT